MSQILTEIEIYPLVVRVKKYNDLHYCMVCYFKSCHVSACFSSYSILDGICHLFFAGMEMNAFFLSQENIDNLNQMMDVEEDHWEVVL